MGEHSLNLFNTFNRNIEKGASPFCDALVRPNDGGLDVDGVIPHPSQLHGLVQRPHHIQGVVPLCGHVHINVTGASNPWGGSPLIVCCCVV